MIQIEVKATKKPKESYIVKPNWTYFKYCFKELVETTQKLNLERIGQRTGDIVVLTGGGRGIGAVVVKKLLQCDFHVVMGLRNLAAGETVVSNIRKNVQTGSADFLPLDLCSLTSVKNFGKMVLKKYSKINILICNAGIMTTPFKLTEDGFESQFQVVYLSHFLLTNILLQRIIYTAKTSKVGGRIVNVSSNGIYMGQIKDTSNFATRSRVYNRVDAYVDAKLCQTASANYLNRILASENANVCCYSLHPGIIPTELVTGVFRPAILLRKLFRTTDDGADAVVHAAIDPILENNGGVFLVNCKIATQNPDALNESLQERLWITSAELLKIDSNRLAASFC